MNFFFSAIVAIIWKSGLIYRNNHPPFLLNCYLYALQTYRTHSSKLRLLLVIRCISLVVDFVLLGGTNSVLLIWGLIVYSVFCQILPRKTVNAFCTASFTSRYKFSYRALERQSRLSVISYWEVNFDWFPKKTEHCDKGIRFGVICFWKVSMG